MTMVGKSLSLIIVTLVIATTTLAQSNNAPVRDTKGHPIQRGKEYYIKPAITDSGGPLTLVSRNKPCPLYVGQENSDASKGLPVIFTPFEKNDDVVKVNRDFKIAFAAASVCVQSTEWKLDEKDPKSGRRLIGTGNGSYFRIIETQFEELMEAVEAKSSSGYSKPPWVFQGRAWYQLHLVEAEKARACIPKQFKLVEAFGYTLGGFFLANYEDSPVGAFDEGLYGTAQHPAHVITETFVFCFKRWATRVYVNSDEACCHGRKEVGLPSQMARFSKTITAISRQPRGRKSEFLNRIGIGGKFSTPKDHLNVEVTTVKCLDAEDTCNINVSLTSSVPALSFSHWMGPTIRMSLPSFSGGTEYNPNLLKYSCQIECRMQAMQPLKVSGAEPSTSVGTEECSDDHRGSGHVAKDHENGENFGTRVMLSKPILALKFSQMKMQVEAPLVLSQCSNSFETTVSSVP